MKIKKRINRCKNCHKKLKEIYKFCDMECSDSYDKRVDPTGKLVDGIRGWLDMLEDDDKK